MSSIVSNDEIIYSNMLQLEAIIRLLERKKLISNAEIIDEVRVLKIEMEQRIRKNSREN